MPSDAPNKNVPIFMGHGESDPLVKFIWGKQTSEEIKNLGYDVTFKGYK